MNPITNHKEIMTTVLTSDDQICLAASKQFKISTLAAFRSIERDFNKKAAERAKIKRKQVTTRQDQHYFSKRGSIKKKKAKLTYFSNVGNKKIERLKT